MSTNRKPKNLIEAVRYFSDLNVCTEFVANLRWPHGPFCPRCGGMEYSYLTTRRLWKCKDCKKQYSVKKGTIFEDSPLGFEKWLPAVWLIVNCKNGISSHELARDLGVHQQTAWFMLQRIRLAMQTGSFEKASGEVEVDETFIGGKARNMHQSKRKTIRKGKDRTGGFGHMQVVIGVLERGGEVRAAQVPARSKKDLGWEIRDNVAASSTVYTDKALAYTGLEFDFDHKTVDHAKTYVDGQVHTNGVENFWSLLKRGLHGTYVSVEPFHLHRYIDEQVFRFNHRHGQDADRFVKVLGRTEGRRVTYKQLTGKDLHSD